MCGRALFTNSCTSHDVRTKPLNITYEIRSGETRPSNYPAHPSLTNLRLDRCVRTKYVPGPRREVGQQQRGVVSLGLPWRAAADVSKLYLGKPRLLDTSKRAGGAKSVFFFFLHRWFWNYLGPKNTCARGCEAQGWWMRIKAGVLAFALFHMCSV